MPKHQPIPYVAPTGLAIPIGSTPNFGLACYYRFTYAMHWLAQHQQLFTFTGPGIYAIPDFDSRLNDNPDCDHIGPDPSFAIILHSAPKADTSHPRRQLGGMLIPWRYVVEYDDDVITGVARVTWTEDGITRTLWQSRSDSYLNADTTCETRDVEQIQLYSRLVDLSHGDNNCQRIDTDYWDEGGDTALSKSGTSADRFLKITNTSGLYSDQYASWPAVGTLPIMNDGSTVNVRGRMRGDGDTTPKVWCSGGTEIWNGEATEDWQDFNETFVMDGDYIYVGFDISELPEDTGYYVELDYMFVTQLGKFDYEPDASGGFLFGELAYERMMVAGLNVFSMPDIKLTADQAQILVEQFRSGKAIRGYSGSGNASWGDLMRMLGDGQSDDVDDLERASRRCVMQWGHPCGITVNATSYTNIRGGDDSWFMVQPSSIFGTDSNNCVVCKPAIVAKTLNGENCSVRITSSAAGGNDTSTVTVSATDWTLYEPDDFDGNLDVYYYHELIKVEAQAATGDAVSIKTVALFENSEL
jgi:hypothetical protein